MTELETKTAGQGRIAFLGPLLSYSHLAVESHFGPGPDERLLPQETIVQVYDAVESGQAQFGLAPIENSTEGSVNVSLDRLAETELTIIGETTQAIRHALMSRAEDLAQVAWVASHPQALAQCRTWLAANAPRAEIRTATSTAAAAKLAAGDPTGAAVASKEAAQALGLNLLAFDIGDVNPNWTRFVVLGHQRPAPTGRDKTSLMVATAHRPGSLHQALGPLAGHGLNLMRIESRPNRQRPWEYVFFIDLLGHADEENMASALAELARVTDSVKVLGSFPAGDRPEEERPGPGPEAD